MGGCFRLVSQVSQKAPIYSRRRNKKNINKESYCERIAPLINSWLRLNPHLQFIQNGAPSYLAAYTIKKFNKKYIYPIFWPVYSLDLNFIKTVQNKIKDYIEIYYYNKEEGKQSIYNKLYKIVRETQDSISIKVFKKLINSMRERYQAVINT